MKDLMLIALQDKGIASQFFTLLCIFDMDMLLNVCEICYKDFFIGRMTTLTVTVSFSSSNSRNLPLASRK